MNYISNKETNILGMRVVDVELYENDNKNKQGYYDYEHENKTYINKLSSGYNNFYSIVKTVSHETLGHGYQDYLLENKDEAVKKRPEFKNQIQAFEYSFDSKLFPGVGTDYSKNYAIYFNDPAEIDARFMGEGILNGVIKSKASEH